MKGRLERSRWIPPLNRSTIIVGVVLFLCVAAIALLYTKELLAAHAHQDAIRARIRTVQGDLNRLTGSLNAAQSQQYELRQNIDDLKTTDAEGSAAGQERHDDAVSASPDNAAELQYANTELSTVNTLPDQISAVEQSCTHLSNTFAGTLGLSQVAQLQTDCQHAVGAWRKRRDNWWRAIYTIQQNLNARVDMRYWAYENTDVTPYYQASDDAGSDAETAIQAAINDAHELATNLESKIQAKRNELAALQLQLPGSARQSNTLAQDDNTPPPGPTTRPAPIAPPINGTQLVVASNSPLTSSNVLPLLRATSALRVSTQPNGQNAYVTVPDTPAQGTVKSSIFWTGQMADGRWVGIVPMDSGGSAGIAYALMWVWTNGQAQFVGEIPAENNGLGHLSMSVENGEIQLRWPVLAPKDAPCCPSLTRTKRLTLDGIRLRPLSDTTAST